MRSVRAILVGAALAATLAGCATTQQEAARLQTYAARVRASQVPLRIGALAQTVHVTALSTIVTPAGSAIVVRVHNTAVRPTGDLPILVGLTLPHHGRELLNAAANTGYYRSHLPTIPGSGALTWVLTTRHPLPRGARTFVRIGAPLAVGAPSVATLPSVSVVVAGTVAARLPVLVTNRSSVPQYTLPVFAVATRGGRPVAAGTATIAHLGGGSRAPLHIRLLGRTTGAQLALEAPPTILS